MNSNAMKIVMGYYDSDDGTASSPDEQHRHRSRDKTDFSEADEGAREGVERKRSQYVEKSPKEDSRYSGSRKEETGISDQDPAAETRERRDSDWFYDEELEFANNERNENSGSDNAHGGEMKEPPPPARPDDFRTNSPSPVIRSPTPASFASSTKQTSSSKFPSSSMQRVESQSLVSYFGEEYDDEASDEEGGQKKEHKRRSKDEDANEKLAATSDRSENKTADNSPTTSATDDLDPYAMLDKCLEKEHVSATAAGGNESSSPVPTADQSPTGAGDYSQPAVVVTLPPEPMEPCSEELQQSFVNHFRIKFRSSVDFNKAIQDRKDFRNPSIYEKLIETFGLDELGSNFDPERVFNPHGFRATDFYEEISKAQRVLMEKMEKEKGTGAKTTEGSVAASDDSRKRKSKWDNPAANKITAPEAKVKTKP